CGSFSTELYARRIRCRLREGLRFGTPIESFYNLSWSSAAQGEAAIEGSLRTLRRESRVATKKASPRHSGLHNGFLGKASKVSSRTSVVKSAKSPSRGTASSPSRSARAEKSGISSGYSKVFRQREQSHESRAEREPCTSNRRPTRETSTEKRIGPR